MYAVPLRCTAPSNSTPAGAGEDIIATYDALLKYNKLDAICRYDNEYDHDEGDLCYDNDAYICQRHLEQTFECV